MVDGEAELSDEMRGIGRRLRAARHERGWTLQDAATRAGMSPSTLSRIESGKRQYTLELLLPLVRQLGIGLDELVEAPVRDPRVRRSASEVHGVRMLPLAPEGSPLHVYRMEYPAASSMPEPRTHEGYEWLYVLSGRLRLRLRDQEFVLTRGEAAEFDTRVPHAMTSAGPRPVAVLSVFERSGERAHTVTVTPAG